MNLDATLEQLAQEPDAPVDLAGAALWVARDEYPNLDVDAYLSQLDGLAHEARPYLGRTLESQVAGLCRYLFHEVGFGGNQTNYYDPRNSYLNEVIDRMTGIPLTLSLVTMAVGERLGLQVDGVALPGHFVVMARRAGEERIVFDPFDQGRRLEVSDCERLVREAAGIEVQMTLSGLERASAGTIIARLLTNLKGCHMRLNDYRRAARVIGRLKQLMPHDWTLARDLGTCYLHTGRPGKAIDEFNLYLQRVPKAVDADAVRKFLRRARGEVAKWN